MEKCVLIAVYYSAKAGDVCVKVTDTRYNQTIEAVMPLADAERFADTISLSCYHLRKEIGKEKENLN